MKPLSGNKRGFRAVGVMSGTSLDGLDIAACIFTNDNNRWVFFVENAATIPYTDVWESRLRNSGQLTGENLLLLHVEYGIYIGKKVKEFTEDSDFHPELIASHGHTVFHQPGRGMTFQAGHGAMVAATAGIPVIADFRTTDVALGGEGAPLVPAGDLMLFPDYDFWLNLGGFANISSRKGSTVEAFDICPVNFVLNHFTRQLGHSFDQDGGLGRQGKVVRSLLEKLNGLSYYHDRPPKSLGSEWVTKEFFPCFSGYQDDVTDFLRTIYEHIALQIGKITRKKGSMLVTGGGAFNKFLTELIALYSVTDLKFPDEKIIKYKEAIIFAFLGVLRYLGESNCFSSATGAIRDSSCGAVYLP